MYRTKMPPQTYSSVGAKCEYKYRFKIRDGSFLTGFEITNFDQEYCELHELKQISRMRKKLIA
ncbi:hypothetical protein FJZ33_04780 [Candidatus Poribacteria bacterium]|nr:hypothetical protein [Candidatus Poribacteria bacterium]